MMEPLRIVDVIVDKVGSPRGDGTAGSSLYLVPIRLSRAVTEFEALRTVAVWDKLKPFPYRHRPGTVTVAGDTVSFAATTIDEYREVHKATLDRVLDQVNGESAHQQRERETAAQVEQAHRQHVAEVAGLASLESKGIPPRRCLVVARDEHQVIGWRNDHEGQFDEVKLISSTRDIIELGPDVKDHWSLDAVPGWSIGMDGNAPTHLRKWALDTFDQNI